MQPDWPEALILPDITLHYTTGHREMLRLCNSFTVPSGQTDYERLADVIPSLAPISNDKSLKSSPRLNFNAGNFYDQYFPLSTMDILTGSWYIRWVCVSFNHPISLLLESNDDSDSWKLLPNSLVELNQY